MPCGILGVIVIWVLVVVVVTPSSIIAKAVCGRCFAVGVGCGCLGQVSQKIRNQRLPLKQQRADCVRIRRRRRLITASSIVDRDDF